MARGLCSAYLLSDLEGVLSPPFSIWENGYSNWGYCRLNELVCREVLGMVSSTQELTQSDLLNKPSWMPNMLRVMRSPGTCCF